MKALQIIEMFAGTGPDGKPVAERLQVRVNDQNECQLVKSPAFVKGLASGDVVKLDEASGQFELTQRSGNLCIRVFSKEDIAPITEKISPALEKLGGELDIENRNMLVFSIHVSCGFDKIEAILDGAMNDSSVWYYGNVYDVQDGKTPLNWWQEILEPS